MGKNRKYEKGVSQKASDFDQITGLAATIEGLFLKDRVTNYVERAAILVQELTSIKANPKSLQRVSSLGEALSAFGKDSRVLDMILAISGASGYLPAQDKATAQKIRQFVERKLDHYAQRRADGTMYVLGGTDSLYVETHSKFGRRIAGLFARLVSSSASNEAPQKSNKVPVSPESADNRIKALLLSAKSNYAAGRVEEAVTGYSDILDIDRKNGEAIRQLGKIYLSSGSIALATKYLNEAYLLCPRDAELINELASALYEDSQFEEALKMHNEALAIDPHNVSALGGVGLAYLMEGADQEALDKLSYALKLSPNSADIMARLGYYHHLHNELDSAAEYYTKALKLTPQNPLVLDHFGVLLCQQRKKEQGLGFIDKALRIQPHNIDFLYSKAHALLAAGDYTEGWALYEFGVQSPKLRKTDLFPNKPIWKGEPIPKKKLLILSEQGLGDVLHFVRYAALCKERVGKVYVLCRPPLIRLLKNCPYIDKVYTGIGRWKFDEQISMMSLPHIFKTTLETVPARVPYLFVPPKMQEEFGQRLHLTNQQGKLKVGILWSGSMFSNSRRGDLRAGRRNMSLEQLLPLFDCKEAVFCNLQMGDEAKQIDMLSLRDQFVDCMAEVKDMLDTAAIIQNLDLVISVDTSVAHLVGGLGKPVWIMSRYDADWRWLMNRPNNPWYPTARIFGQPSSGDWASVVTSVSQALREQVEAHKKINP